jgi:hypothetical protein
MKRPPHSGRPSFVILTKRAARAAGRISDSFAHAKPVPVSYIARSAYTSIPACTTVGPSCFGIFGSGFRFIAFSRIGAMRSAF